MRRRGVPDRASRMAVACADCGAPLIPRTGVSGRQAERCPACRLARRRRLWREARARRLSGWPPECCPDCGAPNNDGEAGRCPECSAR